jgi:hypothetical protein
MSQNRRTEKSETTKHEAKQTKKSQRIAASARKTRKAHASPKNEASVSKRGDTP